MVNYAMDFDDVDEDQWYTEAVRWAASRASSPAPARASPDAALTPRISGRHSLPLRRRTGGRGPAGQLCRRSRRQRLGQREAMNWAVAQGPDHR